MTIDVGTGDGRAVLATAAAEPATLAIGLDADAASMAESSRRAARSPRRGGHPNALFLVAAAADLPVELAGLATRVTVVMPWGSLLRGCLGDDARVAAGLAGLLAAGGTLELVLAPATRDRIDGMPLAPAAVGAAVARTFLPWGLGVAESRAATADEVRATRSTWARRLIGGGTQHRTAILVRLR